MFDLGHPPTGGPLGVIVPGFVVSASLLLSQNQPREPNVCVLAVCDSLLTCETVVTCESDSDTLR